MLGDMVHGGRLAVEGGLGQWMDVSGRGGGMGFRPTSSRGEDLDVRTGDGRGGVGCGGAIDSSLRFATFRMTCGVRCARNDMWGALRTE